eukprot:TRINITY_DN5971_c0_g1_i1.p1 TRINITY_DN5971_c0_g1~~TRINITY_DN5971_c0_g1_i1.p1  ORF type:complete len:605 (-),score=84.92 TRINITY_DN5971_c0_g1_i1:197-2011(-)
MVSTMDGEDRVVATAHHILKTLGPTTDLTNDMLSILSTFDHRRRFSSSISSPLDATESTILRCEDTISRDPHWEDSPSSASHYLSAVDHLLDLTLSSSPPSADPETLDRADTLLQTAMSRLEDELRLILLRNAVPLDADLLYRRIPSAAAGHDDNVEIGDCDGVSELLRSDAVDCLREIVDRMVRAGYEKECSQAYVSVRRDALDECLSTVGVERLSIEDVQKIEWKDLDDKMKKWCQSIKIAVRFLFPGERHLTNQIFRSSSPIAEICFAETAKCSVMKLLNFAEAVSIGRPASEKLFRILDMYESLTGAIAELENLFSDIELGEFIFGEARVILAALREAVKCTFAEFESAVRREPQRAVQGGEIHPLTRYVMNYIKLLVDYSNTLNSLLDDCQDNNSDGITPIGCRLVLIISYLESNLNEKSKLYEDGGLQYVFLMNNILYIVKKIKDSELRSLFGDQWVRKHRGQVRQYSTSYLRASWTGLLSCLKDDGLSSSGSSRSASKMMIKERFKKFNLGFEEIYRNQTGWKVSDPQLREELQLSVSEKVIPAYRSFVGRFGIQLESGRNAGKYVKYSPEDMENLLLDLFEGSPGSLNHPRRKLSA